MVLSTPRIQYTGVLPRKRLLDEFECLSERPLKKIKKEDVSPISDAIRKRLVLKEELIETPRKTILLTKPLPHKKSRRKKVEKILIKKQITGLKLKLDEEMDLDEKESQRERRPMDAVSGPYGTIRGIPFSLKTAVACIQCLRIKTISQFYLDGCENCYDIEFRHCPNNILKYTTPVFTGFVALMDAYDNIINRVLRPRRTGIYATSVSLRQLDDKDLNPSCLWITLCFPTDCY